MLRGRCICAGDWQMQPCFCTWQAWHHPEGVEAVHKAHETTLREKAASLPCASLALS